MRETRSVAPMLVYDGDCAFCSRCARWLQARARGVRVVPWQSIELAEVGLTEEQVSSSAYWVDGADVEHSEVAIARALMACSTGYAGLGRVLLLPGVRRLAGVGYRFVARHRGRISAFLR